MVIGGRIIPSFTRNWLAARGASRLPVPFNRQDGVAIATALAALLVWVVRPEGRRRRSPGSPGRGSSPGGWRGGAAGRRRPSRCSVLHVAFGFLGLGYLAIAAGRSGG